MNDLTAEERAAIIAALTAGRANLSYPASIATAPR
jgi:hypothetical protein